MFRQTASFWLISSICASRSLKGGKKIGDLRVKSEQFLLKLFVLPLSHYKAVGGTSLICFEVNRLDHIMESFGIFFLPPKLVID